MSPPATQQWEQLLLVQKRDRQADHSSRSSSSSSWQAHVSAGRDVLLAEWPDEGCWQHGSRELKQGVLPYSSMATFIHRNALTAGC